MKKLIPYGVFAAVLAAVSAIFYIDTLDMSRAAYQLPRLLIFLVLFLSILMLIERAVLIYRPPRKPDADESGESPPAPAPEVEDRSLVRIAVFIALLVGYVLTIKPLGYFIATPVFLIAILAYLRATRLPWIAAIALGFTVFVYMLFVLFLKLPVPMGILA